MVEISLKAQQIFSIGNFNVTNGLFLTLVVSLILISLSIILRSKIKMVPGKLQGAAEMGIEALLGLMDSTLGSMEAAEKYLSTIAGQLEKKGISTNFPRGFSLERSHRGKGIRPRWLGSGCKASRRVFLRKTCPIPKGRAPLDHKSSPFLKGRAHFRVGLDYILRRIYYPPHCHLVVELRSSLSRVGVWLRIAQSFTFLPYRRLLAPPHPLLLGVFGNESLRVFPQFDSVATGK